MEEVIYKATSLLTEKSFEDGDHFVIRGFATTPTPDRVGDVVVPDGIVFRSNDIKLHLYHDTRLPVGNAIFRQPAKKGIPFEGRLPYVKEDGVVKDRVNEAIHSIKYDLISAVSIGFRAIDGQVDILQSGAYKFKKWEIIELSLTSVPMNPEATFQAMKSIDSNGQIPYGVMRSILNGTYKGAIPLISKTHEGSVKLVAK